MSDPTSAASSNGALKATLADFRKSLHLLAVMVRIYDTFVEVGVARGVEQVELRLAVGGLLEDVEALRIVGDGIDGSCLGGCVAVVGTHLKDESIGARREVDLVAERASRSDMLAVEGDGIALFPYLQGLCSIVDEIPLVGELTLWIGCRHLRTDLDAVALIGDDVDGAALYEVADDDVGDQLVGNGRVVAVAGGEGEEAQGGG